MEGNKVGTEMWFFIRAAAGINQLDTKWQCSSPKDSSLAQL